MERPADVVTLDVAADWQLDGYGNWPDPKPNGSGVRLGCGGTFFDVAAGLVADALAREGEEHG